MQVGDLPLVFELSGVHTPPKGGGERLIRSQSSDSSGMSSRPNASGESASSSGISSRPNARASGESLGGASPMSNGRSEHGAAGAPPAKPNGRDGGSSAGTPSAGAFSLSAVGGFSSLPHAGHEEVPDETNPQIGHSYTLAAVGFHASRCRKSRWDSSKRRIQRTVENYHENRCNNTGNYHHRETYTHPFLSGDWIGSTLTN